MKLQYILILILILILIIVYQYILKKNIIENYSDKIIGKIIASPVELPPQGSEVIMRGLSRSDKKQLDEDLEDN
jgi:hypothetical protein